jgi:hypothetical protein
MVMQRRIFVCTLVLIQLTQSTVYVILRPESRILYTVLQYCLHGGVTVNYTTGLFAPTIASNAASSITHIGTLRDEIC